MNLTITITNFYNSESEPKIYNPLELENRFNKLRFIKSGGEGCVYEVEEKETRLNRALKISKNNIKISKENKEVAKIIAAILDKNLSPHLTRIHELLTVKCPVFALPALDHSTKFFNGELKYRGEGPDTYPRRATLMELMKGDVGTIQKDLDRTSTIAFLVQLASINVILTQLCVTSTEVDKFRNILYKQLDSNDAFNGKKMSDFEFWKYVFGNHAFYLPMQKYLIKVGDFESWMIRPSNEEVVPLSILENQLIKEGFTIDQARLLFTKPTHDDAKILEVYDASASLEKIVG